MNPSGSVALEGYESFIQFFEILVPFLGQEDPLEKGKATHSSILAWRIPWTVYSPWGRKESDTTERLSHFSFLIAAVLAL